MNRHGSRDLVNLFVRATVDDRIRNLECAILWVCSDCRKLKPGLYIAQHCKAWLVSVFVKVLYFNDHSFTEFERDIF